MFVLPFVAMQKRSESVSVAANAQQLPHLPSLKYGIIGMPHVSINSVPELCDRESEREREGGGSRMGGRCTPYQCVPRFNIR